LKSEAADYDCLLGLFPARQVSEIILNEAFKNTEHALIRGFGKAPQGILQ
jgi:hypothetical protein